MNITPEKRTAHGYQPGPNAEESKQAAIVPSDADDGNLARVKAALGLAGHEVREMADGFLVVSPWAGLAKHCPDLRALAGFARQLGVSA